MSCMCTYKLMHTCIMFMINAYSKYVRALCVHVCRTDINYIYSVCSMYALCSFKTASNLKE